MRSGSGSGRVYDLSVVHTLMSRNVNLWLIKLMWVILSSILMRCEEILCIAIYVAGLGLHEKSLSPSRLRSLVHLQVERS